MKLKGKFIKGEFVPDNRKKYEDLVAKVDGRKSQFELVEILGEKFARMMAIDDYIRLPEPRTIDLRNKRV